MFFTDGKYGWSETHWNKTIITTVAATLAQGLGLAKVRSKLLGYDAGRKEPNLAFLRASNDLVQRDSLVQAVNYNGGTFGGAFNPVGKADLPYSVTLLRAESGPNYRKQIYLSGVPDSVQVDPSPAPLDPDWFKLFLDYQQELVANWGFKSQARGLDNLPLVVLGMTAGPPISINIPAHGLTNGDVVRVSNTVPKWPYPGYHTIHVTDANNFTLTDIPTGFAWLSGGLVTKRAIQIQPYTNVIIIGETHRKRGRPFGSPRGRSVARA